MDLTIRPRRLRGSDTLRRMVRETRMDPASLIYPMFVMDGENTVEEIQALPGQYRYTVDRMEEELARLTEAGVDKVMFFGIPEQKDEIGSQAYSAEGIVQRALRKARRDFPDMYLITDVCMCEYTSHGHCGAGADMVAPSDMMDGRVRAIRQTLDAAGHTSTPIMSYAVKYASSFYGPFREAAGSAPSYGDRKSYQMDFHNRHEAIREALLDVEEGADIIMVKPAMSYLDIVRDVRERVEVPVAAYSVSAMIKAAAARGWIDEEKIMCEAAASVFRAGASVLLTYYAKELAACIRAGKIG